ncbi:MAG: LemA family protein [Pseudomonadota bacterium]
MSLFLMILIVALALWAVAIYNLLVRDKNRVLAAWSDIAVQLKRRHDLIPKLVEVVQRYAGYERATLERVVTLRSQSEHVEAIAQKGRIESELAGQLHRLIALAEQYPDLKASAHFLALQRDLSAVEDHIQYARRYYNGAVRNLNIRVDSFPDLLIARLFGYRHAEYFQLDDANERHPARID